MDMIPCPKGCSPDMLSILHYDLHKRYVKCDCGWEGPGAEGRNAAIEAWNRRAAHPVTVDLLERWFIASRPMNGSNELDAMATEIRAAIAMIKETT